MSRETALRAAAPRSADWQPRTVILDRPQPVPGENLAGKICVGTTQAADPRQFIQDRVFWVAGLELLPSGIVRVTLHDGAQMMISPSAWARLE